MSSIVISGDTSGSITVAAPAVSGTNTATLPAATGTVMVSGNMPAFSAYATSGTSISTSVQTKLAFQAKNFDTASAFDNTTNYRFTPQVAGYYQISGTYLVIGGTNINALSIYKNGSLFVSTQVGESGGGSGPCISSLVYLNGSTDYVELYAFQNSGGTLTSYVSGSAYQWFSGAMVRTA